MKQLLIMLLFLASCVSKQTKPTSLSYAWWNPNYDKNFDERSRWMKGVIFSGETGNAIGFSEGNESYYYYIDAGNMWMYTYDSIKQAYRYTPMKDSVRFNKFIQQVIHK